MTSAPVPTKRTAPTTSQSSLDRLFDRWQNHGDTRAREELVKHYLPLATKLARRYHGAHEPLDDLKQVASLGLVKAIDRYEPSRGVGFQSFAIPTILGELKRYFRDCGWAVHLPRGIQELALKVERAQRTLSADSGRSPTYNEIAQYLEISIEDVLDALEASAAHHAVSLDTPHDDGEAESGTLGDSIGELDPSFDLVDLGACVAKAAGELSERERRVLGLRFLADKTQMEIAQEIGVSQMQVSRILNRALAQLAQTMDGAQLSA